MATIALATATPSTADPTIPQDLWSMIKDLDPINNYVTSHAPTVGVFSPVHQWINDPIAPVTGQNTAAEGADTTYFVNSGTAQSNITEIIERAPKVSKTDINSRHEAIGDRWAREKSKRMTEWGNQFEFDAVLGQLNTGASATGAVGSVFVMTNGTGYTSAPTVTFSAPPSGTTATGTAVVANGQVTSVTITLAGSGYTAAVPPTISFTGGAGSGATAIAIASFANTRSMGGMVYQLQNQVLNGSSNANVGTSYSSGNVALTSGALNGFLGTSANYGRTIDTVLVGNVLKSRISSFTVNNTREVAASDNAVYQTISVYNSDFGPVHIQYHRYAPGSSVIGYVQDFFAVGFLDHMHYEERPAAGYYVAGSIVGEPTCQLSNPFAGMYQQGLM
jgi:hypothetical protein